MKTKSIVIFFLTILLIALWGSMLQARELAREAEIERRVYTCDTDYSCALEEYGYLAEGADFIADKAMYEQCLDENLGERVDIGRLAGWGIEKVAAMCYQASRKGEK